MNNSIDILKEAKALFETEIEALRAVESSLDDRFIKIVEAIVTCKGKVVITGMGKPGHIGCKIAATMASLGTPSFFLHPAEAQHGDLGVLSKDDIVIAISYSGESEEITRLIPNLKMIGLTIIGISGKEDSTLIKRSDLSFVFPKFKEACSMNLAPTSSTTVTLAFGDALAVCASKIYGFSEQNFALFHPAGSLGKKLLYTVKDLMFSGDKNAAVNTGASFKDAIIEMSTKALGIVNITDGGKLKGIFTDGDLRRVLSSGLDVYNTKIDDMMINTPLTVSAETLAVEALTLMNSKKISALPVVDGDELIGTVRINDILGAGIIL